MSIKYKSHYIDGYKLPINLIEKMSTQRILNYISKVIKREERYYLCECCLGECCQNIINKKDFHKLNEYRKIIYSILNSREDLASIRLNNSNKSSLKNKKNHGCNRKSKKTRKQEKRAR